MRVAILTFQFAHNYGAMLQAYALKAFLEDSGYNVEIVPYYPMWAQKEYSISPFTKGISFKKRVRFAVQYPLRRRVVGKFDEFKTTSLTNAPWFDTYDELINFLNGFDCVIFGSDQIWNDNLTGRVSDYYGGDTKAKRISYAASLGTKELTAWQKECAKKYLTRFNYISVREPHSMELLDDYIDMHIETVMDPVFLLSEKEWEKECKKVAINEKYMLLYFLRDNDILLKAAKKYAEEKKLCIYEIHPTLAVHHKGCHRLVSIGPREFLWLIKNAQCVCTNSFHATSFSMIFGKKLLHIPNAYSPERTTSLLVRMGYKLKTDGMALPLYDLSNRDYSRLHELADNSKRFLLESINEVY